MPELYFITSPAEAATAAKWGHSLAHMAYGTGETQLELTVGPLALTTRGGWMVLTDHHLPPEGDVRHFAAQVRQEYRARQYQAVFLDFEQPANDYAYELIAAVSASGLPLVVPETYANVFPHALVLIDSAISGGNIKSYLEEKNNRWLNRICLALHPLRMRFPLPSKQTEGENIARPDLYAALENTQSYFSKDLGCRYFTQRIQNRFFFTIYDDADSLRYKLDLAEQLGIRTAVALYREIETFLPL